MLDELNRDFGIDDCVLFDSGAGAMDRVRITTPAAQANVYLHGATVGHFQPVDELPVLFRTPHSAFRPDKAIRGGIPICFPWFGPKEGDASAPAHGFARVMPWTVESTRRSDDDSAELVLSLRSDHRTLAMWPHEFSARYTISVGRSLGVSLEITNQSAAAFTFTEALHSYFAVGDSTRISITGLEGVEFSDKVAGKVARQGSEPITITGETDRVYLDTRATCVIHDPVLNRRIVVEKDGSDSTVVWNPWVAKSKSLSDFGDDEWQTMVCIESANALGNRVTLPAGKSHTITQRIRVERA